MSRSCLGLLLIIGSISAFGSTFSVTANADGYTCHNSGTISAACRVEDPPYDTPFTLSAAQAQVTINYQYAYRSYLQGSFEDYTAHNQFGVGSSSYDNITVQFTVPTYWGNFTIGNDGGGGYDQLSTYGGPDLISFNSGQCVFAPNDSIDPIYCSFNHVVGTQQTVTISLDSGVPGYDYYDFGGFNLAITDLGPPITTPEPATFALTGLFSLAAAMTYFFRNSRYFRSNS